MDDDECIDSGPLCVYERNFPGEPVPQEFLSTTLLLDARVSSSLDWSKEFAMAQELILQGKRILFDFEFGILQPLSHVVQFQATSFALAYFREEFFPHFASHTIGAILFRSNITSVLQKQIQEQIQKQIQEQIDYAELLAGELPPSCEPFLLFDAIQFTDIQSFISQFRQDRFHRFKVAIKNAPVYTSFAVWEKGIGSGGYIGKGPVISADECSVGILIPPFDEPLPHHIADIITVNPGCKIIPESMLTIEWDGLERIILPYKVKAMATKRALDGFCAAGGILTSRNS